MASFAVLEIGELNIKGQIIKYMMREGAGYVPHGYANGYVEFKIGDKDTEYIDFDFDVHGGLTFGDRFTDIAEKEVFWLGFDTAHCQDGPHLDRDYVMREIERLAEQIVVWELKKGVR